MIKYIIPTIIILILDAIYLYTTKPIMEKQIKNIQNSSIKLNMLSVTLCYITIILGLYYFIWKPHKPVKDAFLLGLFSYGIIKGRMKKNYYSHYFFKCFGYNLKSINNSSIFSFVE